MNKIQIVSWLLTRRCNLRCSYCAIVRDYDGKPKEYPDMKHYIKNEMSTDFVIRVLKKLKKHNPNHFNIFYGGEPLLRKDLPDIINFCNENDINYTIITNNSEEVQPMMKRLFEKTEYIVGLTSSVDPLVISDESDSDRVNKCVEGFHKLIEYRGIVKDLVAEITVDNRNVPYLYNLVDTLSNMGINSDITFIDIAKNQYYDFSNVTDTKLLVPKTKEIEELFQKIIDDKLDVHMAKVLLPKILDTLPSNLDCGLEKNVHNMSIDADGSVRLCLRIRGVKTPRIQADKCFRDSGQLTERYKGSIIIDKEKYCKGCNWTCMIMSELTDKDEENTDDLVHKQRRQKVET